MSTIEFKYQPFGEIPRECPRCLFTSDVVHVPHNGGQCEYCDLHDKLEADSHPSKLQKAIATVRNTRGKYNCLIGISGGLDSSTLLWLAKMKWGLNPLVIHFDNGWNGEAAKANMANLCKVLDVPVIVYHPAKQEYDNLNHGFLGAGVPDADIPNDIAMTKLMYQTAQHYGIKWILNGHDFRQEGSTPAKWTYMDAKYIQDVAKRWNNLSPLRHYPLFTFMDQVKYGLLGIKQVRPFHYITDRTMYENDMKSAIGWQDYGAKHGENIWTEYIGAKLLPEKFGIDKRIVYYSAQVRSGTMSKADARKLLHHAPKFDMSKLGNKHYVEFIENATRGRVQDRKNYDHYDFRSWPMKPIIWLLAKFKVVPQTFYIKYCTK